MLRQLAVPFLRDAVRPFRAFEALERGFAVNDPGLNTLPVDPLFDPIRGDARFDALLKRVDVTA